MTLSRCAAPECHKPIRARGWCVMHWQRWYRHGSLADPRPTVAERLWGHVRMGAFDDCWPWTGQVNSMGYGRVAFEAGNRRVRILAHRLAYRLATGRLIEDQAILHRCDNPPCCNPIHLRPGTQLDNIRDAMAKGRLNLSGLALSPTRRTHEHRTD